MKPKKSKKTARGPRRTPALSKAATGIQGLDELTGGGLPKGRPTLLCGGAGCGKTLMAMEFLVRGALESDEPGVFMAFEENAGELAANFASLGYDLKALVAQKKLALDFVKVERSEFEETGAYDLEGLFIRLGYAIDSIGAKRVVLDTIEVLFAGLPNQAILRAELQRLFGWLKERGVTAIVTGERGEKSLTRFGLEEYVADCVILLDHRVEGQIATRRLLRDMQTGGERNRFLTIVKSRGMAHSNQVREFLLTDHGVRLRDVYVGPSGDLLAGGEREALEALEKAQILMHGQETEGKMRALEHKRQAMEAQIAVLRENFEVEQVEAATTIGQDQMRAGVLAGDRIQMAHLRQSGSDARGKKTKRKSGGAS